MSCYKDNCGCKETTNGVCYVGKEYDGIAEQGDKVTKVLENIIEEIKRVEEETTFNLNELEYLCDSNLFNLTETTLQDIVTAIYKDLCEIKNQVEEAVSFWYSSIDYPFITGELDFGVVNTNGELIQAIIDSILTVKDEVESIIIPEPEEQDNSALGNFIENKIYEVLNKALTSCSNSIRVTGEGKDRKYNILHTAPDRTILFGSYPLLWFDSNGVGKKEYGMCDWYLADGRNGTDDMRGFIPIGATSLGNNRPLSDKANDTPTVSGSTQGEKEVKLSVENIPTHNHMAGSGEETAEVRVPNLKKVRIQNTVAPGIGSTQVTAFSTPEYTTTSVTLHSTETGGVRYPGGIRGQQNKPESFSIVPQTKAFHFIQRISNRLVTVVTPGSGDYTPQHQITI